MENNSAGGMNLPFDNEMNHADQLENLSNLIINNNQTASNTNAFYDDDNLILEQYEKDIDKGINDNIKNEKEQYYQRLFQSFQTSACTVAQMFKDKTSTNSTCLNTTNTSTQNSTNVPQLTPWQSFQNSAGAITSLYKGI
jgi:hypothetical protein